MKNKICYVVTVPVTIRAFFIPQLKYLSKHGYDVTVICSDDKKIEAELGDLIRYIPVDIPRGISIGGSIRAIKELKKIFVREKFDLIQYSTPNAALYASIAAKRAGCEIRNYHLMGLRYLGAKCIGCFILKEIEQIACYNSTSIECVSKSNLNLAINEKLFKSEKATVVWNGSSGGVDLKRFDYNKREIWRNTLRSELGYCDSDFIYGFIGRITGDKGINELLAAFFSLKDNSKLILVGDVENESTLDTNLWERAQNHPNILIHKAVRDVERYFALIDVLVLPSYREGFGNVVIEAGAVATPAITSDIPGPIDTIQKDITGFVVPMKNITSLAKTMKKIQTINIKKMGYDSYKFVSTHFDSEILNQKIAERKKELLDI